VDRSRLFTPQDDALPRGGHTYKRVTEVDPPTIRTASGERDFQKVNNVAASPIQDVQRIPALPTPYPVDAMNTYPVSRRVNNPANDSPECKAPLA
jgi:hypothetical protein